MLFAALACFYATAAVAAWWAPGGQHQQLLAAAGDIQHHFTCYSFHLPTHGALVGVSMTQLAILAW
jgi:hypothetical protein